MNAIVGVEAEPLSEREKQLKTRLEMDIKENLEGFKKVGNALKMIRDMHLYRVDYATFEEYCREVWDLGKTRSYQLIAAVDVLGNLSTIVDKTESANLSPIGDIGDGVELLPANEAQVRPLTLLSSPEIQQEAWLNVLQFANEHGCRITAALVQQIVCGLLQERTTRTINKVRQSSGSRDLGIPETVQRSFHMFLESVQQEASLTWKESGRKEIARMLREMLASLEEN